MKTLLSCYIIISLLLLSNQMSAQKKYWVNERVPQEKNNVYFRSEGIDTSAIQAQSNAFNQLILDILFYKGVKLSVSQRKELETLRKNTILSENERKVEAYLITGEATVQYLTKFDDCQYEVNKDVHYCLLYKIPVSIKMQDVGGLAAIPLYGQLKRKQYAFAGVLLAGEIVAVWKGIEFSNEASRYHNLLPLYSTNPVYYKQIQDSERENTNYSLLAFGLGGVCYIVGTIEAFSRNRQAQKNKNLRSFLENEVEFKPYTAYNHTGISLIIHLN